MCRRSWITREQRKRWMLASIIAINIVVKCNLIIKRGRAIFWSICHFRRRSRACRHIKVHLSFSPKSPPLRIHPVVDGERYSGKIAHSFPQPIPFALIEPPSRRRSPHISFIHRLACYLSLYMHLQLCLRMRDRAYDLNANPSISAFFFSHKDERHEKLADDVWQIVFVATIHRSAYGVVAFVACRMRLHSVPQHCFVYYALGISLTSCYFETENRADVNRSRTFIYYLLFAIANICIYCAGGYRALETNDTINWKPTCCDNHTHRAAPTVSTKTEWILRQDFSCAKLVKFQLQGKSTLYLNVIQQIDAIHCTLSMCEPQRERAAVEMWNPPNDGEKLIPE